MKKSLLVRGRFALVAAGLVSLASSGFAAPFSSGNLVVIRVGDGSAALSAAAAPVFLDEYTTAGVLVQSVPMPTTVSGLNLRLTLGGTNTAEGSLSRSTDGRYLTLGGYNAAVATAAVAGTTSAATNRVIARVDSSGNVDTTTAFSDGFSAGRIASATTDDGTRFWAAGTGTGASGSGLATRGGTHYITLGATSTGGVIADTPNNNRWVQIFGGQLYTSVSFNPNFLGVASIGTGLPTTTGQTTTLLSGFPLGPTHSHFGYFFADANTLFVTDDGTAANGGGLQKWTFNAGTWTQATSPFPYISPTASAGLRGLTGTVSGSNITLYATSVEATSNSIVAWTSTDGGATGSFSTIVTVPTGTNPKAFRGIALAPAREINVKVDGSTVLTGGNYDFGSFVQGPGSSSKLVTIENTGSAPLTITASGITLTNTPPFSDSGVPAPLATVSAGSSSTFNIAFDTNQAPSTYNGVLTINNNDPDEPAYTVNLSATTTATPLPEADLLNSASPVASGGSVAFAPVNVGATAPSVTLTLENNGTAALNIASAVASSGFTVSEGLPAFIGAGLSDNITVTLDSTATPGTPTGTLTITSDDANEGTYVVNLTATVNGVPEADLFDGASSLASGGTATFPTVPVGSSLPTITLTLTNNGSATLNVSALTPPSGFTVTEGLPSTIGVGASDSFTVQLNSTASSGTTTGALTFTTDDSSEGLYTVNLSATVTPVSGVADWMILDN